MSDKRLFLIDGSALFYRSYFAFIRTPLINSKGENTNASFGFANYLMQILYEEKPDYLAVVFDTKAPTFRHEMYPDYKANREAMPEEMAGQYPMVRDVTTAFGVPILEKDGFEADDIMGTLARQAEKEGILTYLATGDKDMMQLITPRVKMYSMRPGKASEVMDEAYVAENLGLRVDQIIDYMALTGDSSDNIPGVPKVGPKTAQKLLAEYDTLENIYDNLENISGKALKTNLSENRDKADLSRKLVIIDTDVPIDVTVGDLARRPVDLDRVLPILQALEFTNLATRLRAAEADGPGAAPTGAGQYDPEQQHYHLVDTPEKLEKLAADLKALDFIVFDTETTGLDAFSSEVIGISLCWEAGTAWYVPLNAPSLDGDAVVAALKPVFEDPGIGKGAQNIKFDALMLHQHGITVRGMAFDTMIANYLVSPTARQNNLDALASAYLGYTMISIDTLIGPKGKKQKSMADIPVEEVCVYAAEDADITFRLTEILREKLRESEMEALFHEVEMPLVTVLLEMEKHGVSLDTDFLAEMSETLGRDAERLMGEIHEIAGEEFNTNSPQQLGQILFDKLAIHQELGLRRPSRTKTGQYSTSENVLLRYKGHPAVQKILDYRKLTKLKSTYVDALPLLISGRDGRLHTSFNQTVAATGRLSSSDPNLQNIPIRGEIGREIRKAFVPADGHRMLSADYSQVELRLLAHISGDEGLREAFRAGEDIHATTAAAIFGLALDEVSPDQRRKAKEVNFGIIYGISRFGLAGRLGISADEAQQIIMSYFARFPKVNQYMTDVIGFANEHGYVTTLLNRRRYLPEIHSTNTTVRQNAERMAINTRIQGSAADLIKKAMIDIQNALTERELKTRMILQVHDELVFEVPEGEMEVVRPLVIEKMEGAMDLAVELKVDTGVGENWMEAH